MRFVSAASLSLEAYAAAINSSFEGYPVEINFTAPMMSRRVRFEQQDLEASLIALEGGEAVGMAGLAIRGARGWVSGFGVVPRWRRRGLGRRLMSELLERALSCRLRKLSLDVLVGNTAAIRLYEGAGMRITRDLLVLERAADYAPQAAGRAAREAPPDELLRHHWRLHTVSPAWQREMPALLAAELRGLYVGGRRRRRGDVRRARTPGRPRQGHQRAHAKPLRRAAARARLRRNPTPARDGDGVVGRRA